MYVFPALFPPFSNREDLLLTIAVFDNDANTPINLSGTTLAHPGNFTGSNWTVTDGGIITSSITPITIPDFPIGNSLSALALTVGTGLAILAGDPVMITDPTGRNLMRGYVQSYVSATGALVCQIGATFQFEVRTQFPYPRGSDYFPYYDYGGGSAPGYPDSPPVISASLGNGVTIVDIGVVQIRLPETLMRKLDNKTYLASMTMTDSIDTRQLFIGKLPAQYGGVTN